MSITQDYLIFSSILLLLILGPLVLFIYLQRVIEDALHQTMLKLFSHHQFFWNRIINSIGIILHECSHALMAVCFGFKISQFRPLAWNPQEADTLADVHFQEQLHSRRNPLISVLNHLGYVFVGLAPLFGVGSCLLLSLKVLTNWQLPGSLITISTNTVSGSQVLRLLEQGVLTLMTNLLTQPLVVLWFLFLTLFFSHGFTLNDQDLVLAATSFIPLGIFYLLFMALIVIGQQQVRLLTAVLQYDSIVLVFGLFLLSAEFIWFLFFASLKLSVA